MRFSLRLATLICALFTHQLMADTWTSYFPANRTIKAKVMELAASKDSLLIAQRAQQGVSAHKEWFQEYIKQWQGKPLPYHVNFGISKEEYETLLDQKDTKLRENGTLDLEFKAEKNGDIVINTKPDSPINGLIIKQDSVTTPLGIATQLTSINNQDKNSLTGPWSGMQWSFSDFDDKKMEKTNLNEIKGKQVKLAVGKLTTTGEGILYYDVKDIDKPKNKQTIFSYIIYYPLS